MCFSYLRKKLWGEEQSQPCPNCNTFWLCHSNGPWIFQGKDDLSDLLIKCPEFLAKLLPEQPQAKRNITDSLVQNLGQGTRRPVIKISLSILNTSLIDLCLSFLIGQKWIGSNAIHTSKVVKCSNHTAKCLKNYKVQFKQKKYFIIVIIYDELGPLWPILGTEWSLESKS